MSVEDSELVNDYVKESLHSNLKEILLISKICILAVCYQTSPAYNMVLVANECEQ